MDLSGVRVTRDCCLLYDIVGLYCRLFRPPVCWCEKLYYASVYAMQPLDTRYYNDDLVVRTKIEDYPISYIRYFPGPNNEPVIVDAGGDRKILVVGMNMSALDPSIFGAQHTPYHPYPGVVE